MPSAPCVAALALVSNVAELNVLAERLSVRIGIATGLVVVGDIVNAGAAREQTALGETPNLAARLQAIAEPDTIVIADTTRRLAGGLFEYRDLGAVDAEGLRRLPSSLGRSSARSDPGAASARMIRAKASARTCASTIAMRGRWSVACRNWASFAIAGSKSAKVAAGWSSCQATPELASPAWCKPWFRSWGSNLTLISNSAARRTTPTVRCIRSSHCFLRFSAGAEPMGTKPGSKSSTHSARAINLPHCEAVPLLASLLSLPASGRYALPR